MTVGPAILDRDALGLDETRLAKASVVRGHATRHTLRPPAVEKADHRHRLLRARRQGPRGRAAEQRYEVASFQVIELHSDPTSQGRIAGYRTGGE